MSGFVIVGAYGGWAHGMTLAEALANFANASPTAGDPCRVFEFDTESTFDGYDRLEKEGRYTGNPPDLHSVGVWPEPPGQP